MTTPEQEPQLDINAAAEAAEAAGFQLKKEWDRVESSVRHWRNFVAVFFVVFFVCLMYISVQILDRWDKTVAALSVHNNLESNETLAAQETSKRLLEELAAQRTANAELAYRLKVNYRVHAELRVAVAQLLENKGPNNDLYGLRGTLLRTVEMIEASNGKGLAFDSSHADQNVSN